ncbi:Nucleotidylyl transferase [Byssothecium circinans]|uniref:Nucleotidylyl transferase n=1 Tax=Byssothecium circinans TaxID=147558 RepID=A0A6A5U7U3_9PLEO|nr:Nucleotidylyl transferase [Byssothecium circinans]
MSSSETPARISSLRALLPELEQALHSFTSSASKFRIVRTVNPSPRDKVKTLFILDSSFNPPSRAHAWLAESALRSFTKKRESGAEERDGGCTLLLLYATSNADKAPSPASFVQRIALMTIFAEDLSRILQSRSRTQQQNTEAGGKLSQEMADVSIDIGLTTEPYYTDKSRAISSAVPPVYAAKPSHVHLVGYDTLIRFCNPKYYSSYTPPLSALASFFDAGHGLRVTARPYDVEDESSRAFGTVGEQRAYVEGLREGRLETEGFRREWGRSIELAVDVDEDAEEARKGKGVSSTRVRSAAKRGEWEVVEKLCTEGVAVWVRDQGLYAEDDSGKKMND